jgi:N6-adenosine-specific RNA methylase IME4
VKKYQVIYADPPWSYNLFSGVGQEKTKSRTASSHYEVMRYVEIMDLPIKELVDKDCVLFLWATYPMLPEAIKLISAWGFAYKTVAFTCVKKNKKADSWFWGMGTWTRANPEICLLATRGNPQRVSKAVHSVLDSRIREHSQKPDETRDRIVALMGDVPRIELFAREKTPGWDVWGNEVQSDISLDIPDQ